MTGPTAIGFILTILIFIVPVIFFILSLFLIFKKELTEEASMGIQIVLGILSFPSFIHALFNFPTKGFNIKFILLFLLLIQFSITCILSFFILNMPSLKKYARHYGVALLISSILYLAAIFFRY